MTRMCELTGKTVMYGCNVSHANNKTSRRFLPNLQNVSFPSEALAMVIRFRVTPYGIRCVEAKGGLDSYLLSSGNDSRLSKRALQFKKAILDKKLKRK
ncbi:MAG: 50S ribosomal protein L28 [Holosporales bacterium]|jgi:large subunit ribosomal protein L28|nr:50S ribosomal protein L28 [Holosporales bacterium]